jgi:hypothetical protein
MIGNARYFCCDELRRTAVLASSLNGIDFLEVLDQDAPSEADRQRFLMVHFLKDLGSLTLGLQNVRIEGGERIRKIEVSDVTAGTGDSAHVLAVEVDRHGDFSIYTMRLVRDALSDEPPDGIDPRLAAVDFSFKVECPTDFDCAPRRVCSARPATEPAVDYLAKDYASFRRLMLDRMAVLMPRWTERNPADLGVALVEALAYTADQLSYEQDAVATEAYIGIARRRVSVRRHARLVDYFMSEGCNARTWVHLRVSANVSSPGQGEPVLPAGTRLFTRIPGQNVVIPDDPKVYGQAEAVFEVMTMEPPVQALYADHNELHFYTWSDQRCCLPKGATRATLQGHHPNLTPDDILILEEVLSPGTGAEADADPTRRHAVRLAEVTHTAPNNVPLTDPVTGEEITEIRWDDDDALPFALCLSSQTAGGYRPQVSVARGNIVLADHGVTVRDEALGTVPKSFLFTSSSTDHDPCERRNPEPMPPRFRPRLAHAPLTHAAPSYDRTRPAGTAMQWPLRAARPVVELMGTLEGDTARWIARRDLLSSAASAEEFVAEIDDGGTSQLRFGDGTHGKRPEPGTEFMATYRIGNGGAGNIGAAALAHIITNVSGLIEVRNPLPAQGGRDPETVEDVRQRAPVAYRVQQRAVTPADYAEVTARHPDVQRAAATLRWTGSWHTVFLTIDRREGREVSAQFAEAVRAYVERFRMAGHDLEVDGPRFVALEIEMDVCVGPDRFRSDVKRELLEALSNRDLPDGRRGFFHPDNFTFGQPVYLSAIYAVAQDVPGVVSVHVTTFQRLGTPDATARDNGRLDLGRLEVARLDNDPNFAERGVLRITLGGGK